MQATKETAAPDKARELRNGIDASLDALAQVHRSGIGKGCSMNLTHAYTISYGTHSKTSSGAVSLEICLADAFRAAVHLLANGHKPRLDGVWSFCSRCYGVGTISRSPKTGRPIKPRRCPECRGKSEGKERLVIDRLEFATYERHPIAQLDPDTGAGVASQMERGAA